AAGVAGALPRPRAGAREGVDHPAHRHREPLAGNASREFLAELTPRAAGIGSARFRRTKGSADAETVDLAADAPGPALVPRGDPGARAASGGHRGCGSGAGVANATVVPVAQR